MKLKFGKGEILDIIEVGQKVISMTSKDKGSSLPEKRCAETNTSPVISEKMSSEDEDALIEKMDIPVFHDDQHGTAIACAAALLGALRLVKKDIADVKIVANGAGAAGTAGREHPAGG